MVVTAKDLVVGPVDMPVAPSALELLLARGRLRASLAMLGPAFVASVAYVDPGNFATNFQGGAQFGFLLLWVVLAANVMAMLVQYLSAKLGVVTDRDLPELCRARYRPAVAVLLWVQAEVMAMSTDVAEFTGAALGLNLLFGVPLLTAGLITSVLAYAVLGLQSRGYRRFEVVVTALLAVVLAGFLYQTVRSGPPAYAALAGLVPHLAGRDSVLLAVGILGATIMPHAIYLHGALTKKRMPCRDDAERARVLRFQRTDVIVALTLAGVVNMAMLAIAATLFHNPSNHGLGTLSEVHTGLARSLGGGAALAFAVALLASGASSSSVGTYAGQVVMAGFVHRHIPLLLRRGLTMLPALSLLAAGVDPTRALVLSQVVLSFGIPAALIPLVLITRDRNVMGVHVNRAGTTIAATVVAAIVTALNAVLIYQQLLGSS